jgi:hypothetical protein
MPTSMEGVVTLHLETWQQRMIKEFSGFKQEQFHKQITIKPGKGGCLTSYKIPPEGMREGDWLLYLTDAQMTQLQEHLNLPKAIASINITKTAIDRGEVAFK